MIFLLGLRTSFLCALECDCSVPPLGSWVALAIMLPSPRKRGTLFVQVVCTHVQADRVQVDCPLCKLIGHCASGCLDGYLSDASESSDTHWLAVCLCATQESIMSTSAVCILECGSSFPLAFCQYTLIAVCFLLGQQGMTQHAVLKSLLVCECIPSEALESPVCPQKSHDVSDISYEPYPSR